MSSTDNEEIKPFVRPWVRYWARYLDLLILGTIAGAALSFLGRDDPLQTISNFILGLILLVLLIPYEAFMIGLLGTTPGKWALGIKIRTEDGAKLNFKAAFRRSILVWWRGQGAGIPIAAFLTNLNGYQNLKHDLGITTWDRDVGARVSHHPKVIWREIIIYLIIILLVYFRLKSSLLSRFF
ncbi:RDD family protein [Paenibacillus rigui]|uniref:RDD domain-containing protein n=1 Tax=Paenibacillus rigui TaxID=554312 RepID=A0A229UQX8_9BACL|nr:RDD family protein [Paenibacillus rigui]OXM85824.1 hypothetical protein CF651_11340 [Paenibacillus rigui]